MKVRTPKARSQCSAYSVSGSRAIGNAGLEKRTRGLVCQPSCSLASARSLRCGQAGSESWHGSEKSRPTVLAPARWEARKRAVNTRAARRVPALPRPQRPVACHLRSAPATVLYLTTRPPPSLLPLPPPHHSPPPVAVSLTRSVKNCGCAPGEIRKRVTAQKSGQAEKAMPGCLSLGLSV